MNSLYNNNKSDQNVRVRLFGGFHAENFSGTPIDIPNRKASALIGYLALNDRQIQTRERLAGLFWSDKGEEQARASLRQTIRRLRIIFDKNNIVPMDFGRHEIKLIGGKVHTDIDKAIDSLKQSIVPKVLVETDKPVESILYGLEDLDEFFSSWLHVTRQTIANKISELLLDILRSSGTDKVDAAKALLNIDNTSEEAHRCLIRHHVDHRNIPGALNQYKQLWELLDDEYDMEPDEDTQQLVADIKLGIYKAQPEDGEQKPLHDKSQTTVDRHTSLPVISITRFELHGLDPAAELRIIGLRYELIASLVKFRQWIILESIENPEDPTHNGPFKPIPHRHLDYKLAGACFIDSGDVRLILTLTEISTTQYIWSSVFSINLTEWAAVQRQIVRQISTALNIHLTQQQLKRNIGTQTLPLETYDKWLQGQALSFVWRAKERNEASEIFLSVMKDRPAFTPAYCSFVQLENTRHIAFPGIFRSKQREINTLQLAKTALEKDPLDSQVQLCLAWSLLMNNSRDQATNHFFLALDLNENDPWTLISSACGLSVAGEVDDAVRLARQALDLNSAPSNSHWTYQATIKFLAKDYDGCIASSQQVSNAAYYLQAWVAAAYVYLGNIETARRKGEECFSIVKQNWHGTALPTKKNMAQWLWECVPLYDGAHKKCLQDGLHHAGISLDLSRR